MLVASYDITTEKTRIHKAGIKRAKWLIKARFVGVRNTIEIDERISLRTGLCSLPDVLDIAAGEIRAMLPEGDDLIINSGGFWVYKL